MDLVTCTRPDCTATFAYIATRNHPTLCIDHSADANRDQGWTPENSQN